MDSYATDTYTKKLIILFVFDKMEAGLTESTLVDICTSSNSWMGYMDCVSIFPKLVADNFICEAFQLEEKIYNLTSEGRETLANYYIKIPKSVREEISIFVKKNGSKYRKNQECRADYYQNKDGSYMVYLKILGPAQPILELKFIVPDKKTASAIYKKWAEKATDVYSNIYDNLLD